MAFTMYMWDTNQMNEVLDKLKGYYSELSSLKEEYAKLPDMVSDAWTSVNSDNMNMVILSDVEKYAEMLSSLSEIISGLEGARNVYSDNADNIRKLAKTTFESMSFYKT